MPKANTRNLRREDPAIPYFLRFKRLGEQESLARQMRLHMAGIDSPNAGIPKLKMDGLEIICLTAKIIAFLIVFHSGWR